jgi:hypothetical protein
VLMRVGWPLPLFLDWHEESVILPGPWWIFPRIAPSLWSPNPQHTCCLVWLPRRHGEASAWGEGALCYVAVRINNPATPRCPCTMSGTRFGSYRGLNPSFVCVGGRQNPSLVMSKVLCMSPCPLQPFLSNLLLVTSLFSSAEWLHLHLSIAIKADPFSR